MCDAGGIVKAAFTLNPIKAIKKFGEATIAPEAPKLRRIKLPKPTEPDIAARQQHAKEIAIGAYGATDTMLTGGKGLGSAPAKNLWKQLGSA